VFFAEKAILVAQRKVPGATVKTNSKALKAPKTALIMHKQLFNMVKVLYCYQPFNVNNH
jgi:hypothetical protein